jgi:integrase/recombinase XerD
MKQKIFLKRIFHRNEWRYAIVFNYDQKLTELVRSVKNVKWSQTHMCWYAPDNEPTLKQILSVFRDFADIDISEIASSESKINPEKKSSASIKEDEDHLTDEYPLPDETQSGEKRKDGYDAVLFTIGESDGTLIIKFTGRYDREWIKELNGFGKVFYDGTRKEFKLKWSQLAVDSLSDYFSSRGVEVIVKKGVIPAVLKEKREEKGSDVRSRSLSIEAGNRVELLRRYLDENRYSKRTVESYISSLELFFRYFHDRDIDEISSEDISEFIDDFILRLGYSASYQNIMISAIKLNYFVSGGRRVSPDSLSRPRRSRALPKVFSKEEVVKIFDATRNNKHKLMLWLIYSCGLRRSEVINIKLSDLDSERGILNIREGKGNVDRMVPIAAKIWEKITGYIKTYHPKVYLFEGQTGGKYSVESVYSVFKQSLKRAGIQKDVGVHSLRHSYATHLHESGLDIRYIQELLGHKSTRTTEIYTHVSRRNLFAIRSPIEDIDIG